MGTGYVKRYKDHHKVLLALSGVPDIPDGLRAFNEHISRISRAQLDPKTHAVVYYELEGIESKYGIPYAILPEWLFDIGAWT